MNSGSASFVTQQEFNAFHSIDRSLYTILVINLLREPIESMRVIALLLWLEQNGFRNCVKTIVSLCYLTINDIAEEVVTCLNIIDGTSQLPPSGNFTFPEIGKFLGRELSARFIHENRAAAAEKVIKIFNSVCKRALTDIKDRAIALRQSSIAPINDRTLFITFSKGYTVYEWEVRDFFTRTYGDYVESVHMQEVPPNEQPLFARIVFGTTNVVGRILSGTTRRKFTINGKHAWVRKFVPKAARAAQQAAGSSSSAAAADNLPAQFPYIV